MEKINERIKEIRTSSRLNQGEKMTMEKFGQRLGIQKSSISEIESGKRNVTEQIQLSICREFNVNPEWLRTGIGPMFKEPTENERITEFINRILTDEPEGVKVRFISAVSKFTERDWGTVMKVARELVAEEMAEKEEVNRQQLHAELDRQLDEEKNQEEGSSPSLPPASGDE